MSLHGAHRRVETLRDLGVGQSLADAAGARRLPARSRPQRRALLAPRPAGVDGAEQGRRRREGAPPRAVGSERSAHRFPGIECLAQPLDALGAGDDLGADEPHEREVHRHRRRRRVERTVEAILVARRAMRPRRPGQPACRTSRSRSGIRRASSSAAAASSVLRNAVSAHTRQHIASLGTTPGSACRMSHATSSHPSCVRVPARSQRDVARIPTAVQPEVRGVHQGLCFAEQLLDAVVGRVARGSRLGRPGDTRAGRDAGHGTWQRRPPGARPRPEGLLGRRARSRGSPGPPELDEGASLSGEGDRLVQAVRRFAGEQLDLAELDDRPELCRDSTCDPGLCAWPSHAARAASRSPRKSCARPSRSSAARRSASSAPTASPATARAISRAVRASPRTSAARPAVIRIGALSSPSRARIGEDLLGEVGAPDLEGALSHALLAESRSAVLSRRRAIDLERLRPPALDRQRLGQRVGGTRPHGLRARARPRREPTPLRATRRASQGEPPSPRGVRGPHRRPRPPRAGGPHAVRVGRRPGGLPRPQVRAPPPLDGAWCPRHAARSRRALRRGGSRGGRSSPHHWPPGGRSSLQP